MVLPLDEAGTMDKVNYREIAKPTDHSNWSAQLVLDSLQPAISTRDASELASGIARGVVNEAAGFIEFLAKPNSVNDALIGLGQQVDTAGNYYGSHNGIEVAKDATDAAHAIGKFISDFVNSPVDKKGEAFGGIAFNLGLAEVGVSVARGPMLVEMPAVVESRAVSISRSAVGKGGDWPVLNERSAPDVVRQSRQTSCACAAGEMLSDGKLTESQLIAAMMADEEGGANMLDLAKQLGPEWRGHRVSAGSLDAVMQRAPFAAELREPALATDSYRRAPLGHTVVVDGLDEAGNLRIRDPQHGTRYEMMRSDFLDVWTGGAVWRR
jgi:filamentous hemagglutinin